MRAILLSLGLLVPLLAVVPTASAGEWCWEMNDTMWFCCAAPDPVGPPGSVQYFATSTAEQGVFTGCYNVVLVYVVGEYAVECLVEHRC